MKPRRCIGENRVPRNNLLEEKESKMRCVVGQSVHSTESLVRASVAATSLSRRCQSATSRLDRQRHTITHQVQYQGINETLSSCYCVIDYGVSSFTPPAEPSTNPRRPAVANISQPRAAEALQQPRPQCCAENTSRHKSRGHGRRTTAGRLVRGVQHVAGA